MKKAWISIVAVVATLCACLPLTGCNKASAETTTVLYSFESYEEVASVWYRNFIGKAEMHETGEYVTNGRKGLKLTIDYPSLNSGSWLYQSTEVCPQFNIDSLNYRFTYDDIRNVVRFGIDVFNPDDREFDLLFYAADRNGIICNASAHIRSGYTRAEFPVNRFAVADRGEDVSKFYFLIKHESLFDRGTTLYFDNFYAVTSNTAPQVEKRGGTYDVLPLDRLADTAYVYAFNRFMPSVNVEFSTAHTFTRSGAGSLKLQCFSLPETELVLPKYPDNQQSGVTFAREYLQTVNFGALNFSPQAKLSFDAYNDTRYDRKIYLRIADKAGNQSVHAAVLPSREDTTVSMTDFADVDLSAVTELSVYIDSCFLTRTETMYIGNVRLEL